MVSNIMSRRAAIGMLGASIPFAIMAPSQADESLTEAELELAYEAIDEIDQTLASKGTSVDAELQKIGVFERDQINRSVTRSGVSQNDILGAAVNSVAAAFVAGGFRLSAELLIRAKKRDASAYRPNYGTRAKSSPVVARLRNTRAVSGSSVFLLNSGGRTGLIFTTQLKNSATQKDHLRITI